MQKHKSTKSQKHENTKAKKRENTKQNKASTSHKKHKNPPRSGKDLPKRRNIVE